jgi:exonuclease I
MKKEDKKQNEKTNNLKKIRVFKNPILKEIRLFCVENCNKFGNINALEVIDKINSIEDRLNTSGE